MDYTEIRRLFLKVFLGFLGLTAVVAIVSVLGGEFGEIQIKILVTCFALSAASMCSMSCAAFIEKRRLLGIGLGGMVLSIISAGLVIFGIWLELGNEAYWKTTTMLIVAAVAFSHAMLLHIPELDDGQGWVQRTSALAIGVLALQIVTAIWGEINEEGYYRILTAVAIIVGLGTLSVPIMMKLRKEAGGRRRKLVLEQLEGDTYRDSAGRRYRLEPIDSEQGGEPSGDEPQ